MMILEPLRIYKHWNILRNKVFFMQYLELTMPILVS